MVLLQSTPSWDLVITLVFVIGVSYGFIILRERILVLLLSIYTGTVLANGLADPVQKFFNGDTAILNRFWVEGHMSPFMIKAFIFSIVIVLISAKSNLGARRAGISFFELAAYSILSVCVGLGSLFSFMEPDRLQVFTETSRLAKIIIDNQLLWMIAPLAILTLLGGGSVGRSTYPGDY